MMYFLKGGGNVTLFGSHVIDLITYLTGLRAIRVHGVTRTLNSSTSCINGTRRITSPDYAVIQMEMESGVCFFYSFHCFGMILLSKVNNYFCLVPRVPTFHQP